MDPASADQAAESRPGDVSPTGTGPANNAKARKRTKTGCLTCRRRRIKCGEERPTCANCIKSKRQCEGYNQRVVFKTPMGEWPNHPGVVTNLQFHNSMLPGTRSTNFRPSQSPSQPPETTLASIQPRPLSQFDYQTETAPSLGHLDTQQAYPGSAPPYGRDGNFSQPLSSPHRQQQALQSPVHQLPTPTSATSYYAQASPVHANFQGQYAQEAPRYSPNQYQAQHSHDQSYYAYGTHSQAPLQQPQVTTSGYSQAEAYALAVSHPSSSHPSFQPVQIPQHDASLHVTYMPQQAVYEPTAAHAARDKTKVPTSGFGDDDNVSPTQVLDEAAVEAVDDDYWDVDSDEEMVDLPGSLDEEATTFSGDFSLIRKIQHEHVNELTIRRYDAFIFEGVLASYQAEHAANPLKNPKTARVFAHFIHVTGPSLSIYERNPRNPTSLIEGPIPPSQQNLWTYILPLKALNHQGLLHAMLASASLHIARLQRASVTPSYKHYAYALKRLGRSLASSKRRHTIATVATSLLLAFYEVMTAEHVKWSTHLVGAAQLLTELDFPLLTLEARRLKAAEVAQERRFLANLGQHDSFPTENTMPDERLVSQIVGQKISYEDFGRVLEHGDDGQERRPPLPAKLDLKTFETLQDLHWFYLRQDAFQSSVSGNPLITPFHRWADCPPRAPLGHAGAIYGTHDHIILLIARIADFAVRDRPRKLKQVEANGGHWRPSPNMPGGMPPSMSQAGQPSNPTGPPPQLHRMGASAGPGPAKGQGPHQGPHQGHSLRRPPPGMQAFYGMAPTQGPSSLPKSYSVPDDYARESPLESPDTPHPKFANLRAALSVAEEDWQEISRAHSTIASILANEEAFAPLSEDLYPVAPGGNMTPFGPALVHRSYDISAIWTMLHLSKILLMRSHPAMPPAATVAAGVAAPTTKLYAMLIGRIAAGMQVPASDDIPLSPFLGAALIEVTMALFFAGVQYQEPAQRAWLIKRLLAVDRRTGWASAAVIARACETSWERAAELGRGPPYPDRKTRPIGEQGPIVLDGDGREGGWGGGGVVRGKGPALGDEQRFVVVGSGRVRVPWAKNLLASEEELRADMERVALGGG